MLNILLSMGGNSLNLELIKYFSYDAESATCSAFVQQREKILLEVLEYLFSRFTSLAVNPNYYDGYRILAVDGSDLCSRTYIDTIVQSGRVENEFQALIDMVDCSNIKEKTIIIADRGYESYNVLNIS
jgi:hypothetical protein